MKYMGSKNRIAKHILPIILSDRRNGQAYVEPFCGGCNSIDKVDGIRIASDNNPFLISMWNGLIHGVDRPSTIDKYIYDKYRNMYNTDKSGLSLSEADRFMVGWVGFMASYNGKFYDGGYSGGYIKRDYISESIRNIESQLDKLSGVKFIYSDYKNLKIPDNSIVYCDIPYLGSTQYASSASFDHNEFWDWARSMSRVGHSVFVSEYSAPDDAKCVWEMAVTNSMHPTKTKRPVEKLFKL